MAHENLSTYLNDHMAGAVAALELLAHLESVYKGTEVGRFATSMHAEVALDRAALETLMGRVPVEVSRLRAASSWLAERVTQIKLRLADPAAGALYLLEALDALALGIEGKRALWRALAIAAEVVPELRSEDYERMTKRADDQRRRVETQRLNAARTAFRPTR